MFRFSVLTVSMFATLSSWALLPNGNEEYDQEKQELVALYTFDETTGPILDRSGYLSPLNLNISNEASSMIQRQAGSLLISERLPAGGIVSAVAASKITNRCQTRNEMTIEAYIRNTRANQNGPARIVSLSNDTQNRNFTLGQTYDGDAHYVLRVRTTKNGKNGNRTQPSTSSGSVVISDNANDPPQHIIITRNTEGTVRMFVDGALVGDYTDGNLAGDFSNWTGDYPLSLGNELTGERGWRGELHMVAIYCRAKTLQEIVGDVAFIEMPAVAPQVAQEITENRKIALQIYKRLNGVSTPIDDPVLVQMEALIDDQNLLRAAELATDTPHFYNFVVRDFAAKMSTRDETVKTPLNDFIATVIGVTRDGMNAKTLLSGNFIYMGDPGKTAVPSQWIGDLIRSNRHFEEMERQNYDLSEALYRVDGQKILSSQNRVVNNPDAAGLLTTRAFMQAHASAGTNRRLVEYAFRQFTCTPMEQWADSLAADSHIGRDIDRYPGGSNAKFQSTCKSCHTNMDGFRGAFAQFDFSNGIVKNALFFPNGEGEMEMRQEPAGISAKMNQNAEVFPGGHVTEDNSWVNNAIRGSNAIHFGWRNDNGEPLPAGGITGHGIGEFGRLIANSEAFSRCMAQRVFSTVCGRDPITEESATIQNLADTFEANNYQLKSLFQNVITKPACLGIGKSTGGN